MISGHSADERRIPLFDIDFINYRHGLLKIAQTVICTLWLVIILMIKNCPLLESTSRTIIQCFLIALLISSIGSIVILCLKHRMSTCLNIPLIFCVFEAIGTVFFCILSIALMIDKCSLIAKLASMFGFVGMFAYAFDAKISYFWFINDICLLTI